MDKMTHDFGIAVLRGLQRVGIAVAGVGLIVGILAGLGWLLPIAPGARVPEGLPAVVQLVFSAVIWWFYVALVAVALLVLAKFGGFQPGKATSDADNGAAH